MDMVDMPPDMESHVRRHDIILVVVCRPIAQIPDPGLGSELPLINSLNRYQIRVNNNAA